MLVSISRKEMKHRARQAVRRIDWMQYVGHGFQTVHIDKRCMNDCVEAGIDLLEVVRGLAELAQGHIRRMASLDIGCSEMFVTEPVSKTYQMMKYDDKHYLSQEQILPYE